jgi:hypothetical protein
VVPTTYDDTKVGLPHDFEERLAEFFRRWPAHCNTGTYSEQHRCAASIAVDLGLDPDLIMQASLGKWDSMMRNCHNRSYLPNEPTPLTKECAYSAVASSASLQSAR